MNDEIKNKRKASYHAACLVVCIIASCLQGKAPTFAESLHSVDSKTAITLSKSHIDSITLYHPESLVPEVRAIVAVLDAKGDKKAAMTVAAYPYGIDIDERPDIAGRLLTSTLLPGTKAPVIQGLAQGKEKYTATILLFYESSCRSCQSIIHEITRRYPALQEKGVRVVSLSTDTDEKAFTEYSSRFPWADKLCDYKGFHSPAMESYGVAATPTLFLIDRKGIVTGQYGTTEELWAALH